jgi:hypothetical protein
MGKGDRLPNENLLAVGLELMRKGGKPLIKVPGSGRAMIYELPNRERVRVRTCNDHLLIVLADSKGENARLNIEGTEWLLIVMPEEERSPGNALAYLVPTGVAVKAARESHAAWLATNPRSDGNVTWNLWFRTDGTDKPHNNFEKKWQQYRLAGVATVGHAAALADGGDAGDVKSEVESARQRISRAAGVVPEAVKISIDFGD